MPKIQIAPIILLPTPQACWDYGLEREASIDIPVLSSTSPFKFLKGVQFDTKLFKLSENKALLNKVFNIFGDVTDSIVDEVILEALWEEDVASRPEYQVVRKVTEGGIVVPFLKQGINFGNFSVNLINQAIGNVTLKIAPNWQDSLNFSQSHTWGKPDDIISQLTSQGSAAFQRLTRTINTAQRGAGVSATEAFQDYIDRYQGTNRQKITIPFTLFTRNNFIRDIFLPIMYINYVSSPNTTTEGIGESAEKSLMDFARAVADSSFLPDLVTKQAAAALKAPKSELLNSVDAILKRVGVRFFHGQPPRKFRVSHSSKMFKMKAAVIESFSYNFKGPWVKKEYSGLVGTFGGTIGDQIDRQFGDVYTKNFKFLDYTYPLQCECTLELRETEPWYANDWLDLVSDRIGMSEAVEISLNSSVGGTLGQRIAASAAASIPGVLPDIRRSPNGNNWVPPGETITGIPGLF